MKECEHVGTHRGVCVECGKDLRVPERKKIETLDQFKQLDAAILTRAIAEVVCGATTYRMWGENVFVNCVPFKPLTNRDDAVMCVEKLSQYDKNVWADELLNLVDKV